MTARVVDMFPPAEMEVNLDGGLLGNPRGFQAMSEKHPAYGDDIGNVVGRGAKVYNIHEGKEAAVKQEPVRADSRTENMAKFQKMAARNQMVPG